MSAIERTMAVLDHRARVQTPFVPNEDLVPRGEAVRKLINKGMGMCAPCVRTYWSEWPNVSFKTRSQGDLTVRTWETPHGSVTSRCQTHVSRDLVSRASTARESWIRQPEDFGPVIFTVNDERLHPDAAAYDYAARDFGGDCLIKVAGLRAPYYTSYSYFEDGKREGLHRWASAQRDCPDLFSELMLALEQKERRLLDALVDVPGRLMRIEGVSSWIEPHQFEANVLPFFQRYVPLVHDMGKMLCLYLETTRLRALKELIAQTGVDVIDGFTPPPVGDLPLREARAALGDDTTIWINFPADVFYQGAGTVKQYTTELLESDPSGNLVIGLTTLPEPMNQDDDSMRAIETGMHAILDAVEKFYGA